jgi:hypothetical protein
MPSEKIRRRVAWEAARLMYDREETEYLRAKLKAARRVAQGEFKPRDLPSNREIRDQIQAWASLHEGTRRTENLRDMRLEDSENYEELRLLARCDRDGRQRGVQTSDLVEALEYLRELARTCGE